MFRELLEMLLEEKRFRGEEVWPGGGVGGRAV